MTVTDFKQFLASIETDNVEEMYFLKNAVEGEEDFGYFECSRKGEKVFVKCPSEDLTLMLGSKEAKAYFLETLEKVFKDDLGIEGAYEFKRQMEKDD